VRGTRPALASPATLLAAGLMLAGAVLAGCGSPGFSGHDQAAARYAEPAMLTRLGTRSGSYLGVYEPGVPRRYDRVARFAAVAGRQPNLLLYYSSWGQPFDIGFADEALAHGAVPVVQLDPGHTGLSAIAAGGSDAYLRAFAAQVRAFGRPVVIGFAREMNGGWYPWGKGHLRPRDWVAAWRHVVGVFRRSRAANVTWQWTINAQGPGVASPAAWWPGGAYVSWVGIDGYYYGRPDRFAGLFGPTIRTVRRLTGKPVVISEVGMAPRADPPAQLPALFAGIRRHHLLGLVWFDARARRDWRLEDNPRALTAFRRQAARLALRRQE
jgi:hypothetical protein